MIRLTSAEDCRARFGILGGWFGSPPIVDQISRPMLIDGRIRAAEYHGELPRNLVIESPREAVRILSAVGEYERAREYIPANITRSMVSSWAGIPREWVPMMELPKACRDSPSSFHSREVVQRTRKLLEVAQAGERVTAEDLRWALGRFANYRQKVTR